MTKIDLRKSDFRKKNDFEKIVFNVSPKMREQLENIRKTRQWNFTEVCKFFLEEWVDFVDKQTDENTNLFLIRDEFRRQTKSY